MTAITSRVRRFRPDRQTLLWWALLVNIELLLVATYVVFSPTIITDPLILVYPFVWINVGLWAFVATTPAPSPARRRYLAVGIGAAYFAILAYVGGIVNPGHLLHGHTHATGARIAWELPPGWGPAVLYGGGLVQLAIFPYKLAGYAALAYLVYATVLEAAGSAVSGVVGLFSCVSCTWPIVGTVVSGIFGSTSAIAAVATSESYGLSTIVFVSAVGLLYYRPSFGSRRSSE